MNDESLFLRHQFLDLPWPVLRQILQDVPASTIYEILFQVPKLRPLILDEYYSLELHLLVAPPMRPHSCTLDPQKEALRDITSYGEIEDFLLMHLYDVKPRSVSVVTSQDFRSLEMLLENFRQWFMLIERLEIFIDNYQLTEHDIDLLTSFPNLAKLQTGRLRLRNIHYMNRGFSSLRNLQNLVFLGHEIADWSLVTLPTSLKHMDFSWFPQTDILSLKIPDSVEEIYWNQVGFSDWVLLGVRFPSHLRTLMLTHNKLFAINLSDLPRSLEILDLTKNAICEFSGLWPRNLQTILLRANSISSESLHQLAQIGWPKLLQNLDLGDNPFDSLENLRGLPDTLRVLMIRASQITTLEVAHNTDGYRFFKFPAFLQELALTISLELCLPHVSEDVSVPPLARIHFPYGLKNLDLGNCEIATLSNFCFPKSLTTLFISGNHFSNLLSYNYSGADDQKVNWSQLENLVEFEALYNHISSLKDWVPPPKLRKLNLDRNRISDINPHDTALFSKVHRSQTQHLTYVSLRENEIASFHKDCFIPCRLQKLLLGNNSLHDFTFTDAIASHRYLTHLDLSKNNVSNLENAILVSDASGVLQELDLSGNYPAQSVTGDDLMNIFKGLGVHAKLLRRVWRAHKLTPLT